MLPSNTYQNWFLSSFENIIKLSDPPAQAQAHNHADKTKGVPESDLSLLVLKTPRLWLHHTQD